MSYAPLTVPPRPPTDDPLARLAEQFSRRGWRVSNPFRSPHAADELICRRRDLPNLEVHVRRGKQSDRVVLELRTPEAKMAVGPRNPALALLGLTVGDLWPQPAARDEDDRP